MANKQSVTFSIFLHDKPFLFVSDPYINDYASSFFAFYEDVNGRCWYLKLWQLYLQTVSIYSSADVSIHRAPMYLLTRVAVPCTLVQGVWVSKIEACVIDGVIRHVSELPEEGLLSYRIVSSHRFVSSHIATLRNVNGGMKWRPEVYGRIVYRRN